MVEASLSFSLNIAIILHFIFYASLADLGNREMEGYQKTLYLILTENFIYLSHFSK